MFTTSKYFTFITPNEVQCKIMNNQGAYCVLPSTFAYKEVYCMIHLKDRCDFFISFARKNATRTFVPIPRIYTGTSTRTKVFIRLNDVKTRPIIDQRIIDDEQKQEFLDQIKVDAVPTDVLEYFETT